MNGKKQLENWKHGKNVKDKLKSKKESQGKRNASGEGKLRRGEH